MADSSPEPARNNWFLRIFFGNAPPLAPELRRVLRLVALGMAFENYDIGLVNAALPQIAEDLAISAHDSGFFLGAIRLGGFLTILMIPLADRVGRRRVFLAALIGMSLGTFSTAFVQTPEQFVVVQLITRAFMLTGAALAVVILIEEFPAELRGGALGLLLLIGGLGYGFGAALYGSVDRLPHGWRDLYAFGALPLILLPFLRRALPETRRFLAHQEGRGEDAARGFRGWLEPVIELVRGRPVRTAAIGLAGFFSAMGSIVFFQYTSYFIQNVHGWQPQQYAVLVLAGGMIGVSGNVLGGRGSDHWGRKRVGALCLVGAPLGSALFYLGPSSILIPAWGLYVLFMSSADLIIRALASELFPTSHRGTSSGWLVLVQTLGWTTGLVLVGVATDGISDLGPAVFAVSLTTILAAACLLVLPETRRLELEVISGEERPETPDASG
jgi:MFS family permease